MNLSIKYLKNELKINSTIIKNFINLSKNELEIVRKWRNHQKIRKWMYSEHEITKKEHLNFIKSLKTDKRNFYFIILKNETYLGVIYINRLDIKNRHAYFGIYANPEEKIKDAGKILGKILLKLTFEYLKLHSLKLEVLENNERAIRFYKKLGFKEEGILKEFVFRRNKWLNVLIMGMTEDEYFKNKDIR